MRILVVSDTHHDVFSLRTAILRQPKAEVVIHLGDGEEEAAQLKPHFPDKAFLQVRGNCDWGSALPIFGEITLEGKKIFYTHGHVYNVKYGMYQIVCAARERGAQVLLFGHTHQAVTDYEDGLYLMNPGSLHGSEGTYGILDITPAGIVTNIVRL
ncbi:MAG TPA: metallophosphoesterase [Candidatus Caccousia avistercoris]|nr:metallophosphoesterase [Candidatus Caccousia avistercoris]